MYSEISNTLAIAERLEALEATDPVTNLPAASPLLVNTKRKAPEIVDLSADSTTEEEDEDQTETESDVPESNPPPKRVKAFFGKFSHFL